MCFLSPCPFLVAGSQELYKSSCFLPLLLVIMCTIKRLGSNIHLANNYYLYYSDLLAPALILLSCVSTLAAEGALTPALQITGLQGGGDGQLVLKAAGWRVPSASLQQGMGEGREMSSFVSPGAAMLGTWHTEASPYRSAALVVLPCQALQARSDPNCPGK